MLCPEAPYKGAADGVPSSVPTIKIPYSNNPISWR